MPKTRRTRTLDATPQTVWAVVGDPYNLRRWWPRVERVEQVSDGQFTEVLRSERGRAIRADHRLTELDEPRVIAWEQILEGSPFARVMAESRTSVALAPSGTGGTAVTLERRQTMRGWARFGGGIMVRRATGKILEEALGRLEAQLSSA